jgi:hypothetical protein
MTEENVGPMQSEAANPETPPAEPQEPKKTTGISKWILIAGCGFLLLLAVVVAGVLIFSGLFSGKDPIAAVVPNDALVYMSVDLVKTQSEDVNHIVNILQAMSDEKQQTLVETLDETLQQELNLSFTNDVLPWLGRHASVAVTEGDLANGDVKFMFIMETTNKGKADEFITKFTAALDQNQGRAFDESEKDGVKIYTSGTGSDAMAIARSGKFVYLGNSEDAILKSISLQNSDALSKSAAYQATLESLPLPGDRLSTIYISGDVYKDLIASAGGNMGAYQGFIENIEGMGLGTTFTEAGLQLDFVARYDAEKLSDFEKQSLGLAYLPPTTDALVPADTFFFVGTNTSTSVMALTPTDNPLYNADVQESFDLLEQQYGISIRELLEVLGGEFAIAIAPSSDGLLNQQPPAPELGFTIIASAKDEQGFIDWADRALDVAAEQMGTPLEKNSASFGKYELKEASIQQATALVYGADQGYIFVGSSSDMLRDGLSGENTLANSETYRNTWKAFSANSAPYMYLDLHGLMETIAAHADTYGMSNADDLRDKLKDIPVIALAWNQSDEFTRNLTMIVFIEGTK